MMDPIMSSYMDDEMGTYLESQVADTPLPLLSIEPQESSSFTVSVERLLSPDADSNFSSTLMWSGGDSERVPFIKQEPADEDVDMDTPPSFSIKSEPSPEEHEEFEFDTASSISSAPSPMEYKPVITNRLGLTFEQAQSFVEERFNEIANVPDESLDHRSKIIYILSKSDCADYTVKDILDFDKTTQECARACAKIVQNIPQRYRWWCVEPEDIPKCYTIVCNCKKSRSKPPRPMNAFMIWAQGCRRLINILCPKMQNALISEALGYFWRLKSDEFRDSFGEEKLRIRRFHAVEYPEYKYKPESKSQKILKKQQLNLAKANLSPKKEKPLTPSPKAKSTKVGKPKKTVGGTSSKRLKPAASRVTNVHCSNDVKTSPTKPTIKNMLTLKIMNDRKSRGVSQASTTHFLGQLSPLESDNPELGDIFSSNEPDPYTLDPVQDNAMSSSVYDTPANTPPLDADPRQSPLQISVPSPVPLSSPETVPAHTTVCSPTSISTKQAMMPSLTAMLSSPSMTVPASSSSVPISVVGGLPSAHVSSTQPWIRGIQPLTQKPKHNKRSRSEKKGTSLVLSNVAQALVPLTSRPTLSSPTGTSNFRLVPVLGGSYRVESLDISEVAPVVAITTSSLPTELLAAQSANCASSLPNDLPSVPHGLVDDDILTMSLDAGMQRLTDDDMQSLLNTLT